MLKLIGKAIPQNNVFIRPYALSRSKTILGEYHAAYSESYNILANVLLDAEYANTNNALNVVPAENNGIQQKGLLASALYKYCYW